MARRGPDPGPVSGSGSDRGPVSGPGPGAVTRFLMVAVGVTVFPVYAVLTAASYLLIAAFLRGLTRTELLTTALLVVGLTLAFGYLSYRFGTARLLEALDARALPPERSPALYDRLGDLADRLGVETPTVAVARMEMPNALAVGDGRGGMIVVDGRLFRLLSGPEREWILAHELGPESRDSLVRAMAFSLARTLVGFLIVLLFPVALLLGGLPRGVAWLGGRPSEGSPEVDLLRAAVARAVLSVLVVLTLLVRAHSRRREFAADERAAEATGRPLALVRALRTIERASHPAGGLLATLYIHAEESDPRSRMLSTHPPMDERVERLVETADSRERRGVRVAVGRPPRTPAPQLSGKTVRAGIAAKAGWENWCQRPSSPPFPAFRRDTGTLPTPASAGRVHVRGGPGPVNRFRVPQFARRSDRPPAEFRGRAIIYIRVSLPVNVLGGADPTSAFSALGNETRPRIVLELGGAGEPGGFDELGFGELQSLVGVEDNGNFNYHLRELAGEFVERTDGGYRLALPGVYVYRALKTGPLAGTPDRDRWPGRRTGTASRRTSSARPVRSHGTCGSRRGGATSAVRTVERSTTGTPCPPGCSR